MNTDSTIPLPPPDMDPDWRIEWRGHEWRRSDLTVRHARIVAEIIGTDTWEWVDLNDLHPARGPLHLLAVVVACLAVEDGITDRAGILRLVESLSGVRLDEMVDAVRVV